MDAWHAGMETNRADSCHSESYCCSTTANSVTMKANLFLTLISIVLATLVGYLAYNVASGKENDMVCGIGSGICFAATLIPIMGLQYESGRLGTNIRVFSALFFIVFAISHFYFAILGVIMPYYIIVNSIILLIYLSVLYKLGGLTEV